MLGIAKIMTKDANSFILKKVVELNNVTIEDAPKDTNKNANSSNIEATANMDLIAGSNTMIKKSKKLLDLCSKYLI